MMEEKRKKVAIAAVFIMVIVILAAVFLQNKFKKNGVEVSALGIKEIAGNTVEERLLNHNINANNAKITKIGNVDELRKKYSAIFKDAKNGNYAVELPGMVLVYDFEHDRIVTQFYVQNIDLGEMAVGD